eukprot:11498935-Heterocapsa_arctica.AAC.1
MEADHRLVGAVVGWGRTKSIHIMSVYGLDTGQKKCGRGNKVLRGRIARHLAVIGRAPWVVDGNWNLQPGEFTIE